MGLPHPLRWLLLVFAVLASLLFSGCGGGGAGGSSGTGTLAIRLADAPDPTITSVQIVLDRVEAHIDGNWVLVNDADQTIDLMNLIFNDMLIGQSDVPAGRYNQVRLVVASATVTDSQGTHNLVIPSGMQTGIKVNLNYDVDPNVVTEILLDFNVQRSVRKLGNGVYHLQPVIPAVIKVVSGTITGSVTDGTNPLHNATVKAIYAAGPNYPVGTLVNETSSMNGNFKVWALKEGTYTLDITWVDPVDPQITKSATVNDVVVSANQNTDVGTVVLN